MTHPYNNSELFYIKLRKLSAGRNHKTVLGHSAANEKTD